MLPTRTNIKQNIFPRIEESFFFSPCPHQIGTKAKFAFMFDISTKFLWNRRIGSRFSTPLKKPNRQTLCKILRSKTWASLRSVNYT